MSKGPEVELGEWMQCRMELPCWCWEKSEELEQLGWWKLQEPSCEVLGFGLAGAGRPLGGRVQDTCPWASHQIKPVLVLDPPALPRGLRPRGAAVSIGTCRV